ncbi:MAG: hypothetical protein WCV67_21175 [Victivallaceae bacterium]
MNYEHDVKRDDYLYSLRLTLPPWCWREMLDELLVYCRKCRIDEVCVKVDTGTFTHYFPSSDWLKNYQKILFTVRDELAGIGVRYSLNPNVTQGHGDRGRNIFIQHPDWHMITGTDGIKATDCVCSISPGWREYISRQWTVYAETRPALIWIEDDIRTFNHGPVKSGCFCEGHLRRFNEKHSSSYRRDQLVELVFKAGDPAPERGMWLDFLREITAETIALMTKTVHAVSPETIVGLMSSGPGRHVSEGRDWKELAMIISGHGKFPCASRPPLGNYIEYSLEGLVFVADSTRLTRAVFQEAGIEEGEVENYPYTGFSKSNLFMFLQCAVAIGAGCNVLTLNLYDHCGTPLGTTGDILHSLGKNKKFLSALKSKSCRPGKENGVRLYFHSESARSKKLAAGDPSSALASSCAAWSVYLQNMGFSVSFEDSPVTALAGQDIRAASGIEIRKILGGGALCDATAFQALSEMGYGEFIGASIKSAFPLMTRLPLAAEHFYNRDFGGAARHYFALAIHPGPIFVETELSEGAVELSEIVDPDTMRLFPGSFVFENSLGGRIAVIPYEMEKMGTGFADPGRKRMLYNIMRWMYRGRVPLFVSGDRRLLPFRRDFLLHSLCGIANLSHDTLKTSTLEMYVGEKSVSSVEILTAKGVWSGTDGYELTGGILKMIIPGLSFDKPFFMTVNYERGVRPSHG